MKKTFFSWIRPKNEEIIETIKEQTENLTKATSSLMDFMKEYKTNGKLISKTIKDYEHKGDQITHNLFTLLNKTFITPLDPEDISRLTSSIDEVLDATEGVSNRIILFKLNDVLPNMFELAKLLLLASREINTAITKLNLNNTNDLLEFSKSIVNYEHKADEIYRTAIAELFETNNPIEIIKLKEIYETLENALDRCADVADVIEDIALKYGNG